ncbi:MAG: type II toxin-antitoxin system RelE/ParE family toxin [Chloroflexi bacterium]|nr:type II toxin-antitoxin system RelE/ParE family toxin [Chloroflexota bacterium]
MAGDSRRPFGRVFLEHATSGIGLTAYRTGRILAFVGRWNVEITDECAAWYRSLTDHEATAVDAAVEKLEELGPALGRPFVDHLETDLLSNLKELRPTVGNIRILFVFDPRRAAILLLGGDKTGRWSEWYRQAIPEAVRLYHVYLSELRKEGLV